jgi:hypothetical protein
VFKLWLGFELKTRGNGQRGALGGRPVRFTAGGARGQWASVEHMIFFHHGGLSVGVTGRGVWLGPRDLTDCG